MKAFILTLAALSFFMLCPISSIMAQNETGKPISLPPVEIHDSIIQRLTPRTQISQLEMQAQPVCDAGEIIRALPNVSGIRRGGYAVDPVIRGFRYSQLNISLDHGIHIEGGCPNRMDPVLAHIDIDLAERIEITRGPYEVSFGPVHGGLVRLITLPEKLFGPQKFNVRSISGFTTNRSGKRQHLALIHRSPKLFMKATGGIKDYGNYTDGNGREWETSYNKKDLSLDLGLKISTLDEIHFSWKGSFGSDVMFPALPMDEIKDNTHILNLQYIHVNPNRKHQSTDIGIYYTNVYHEMSNQYRPQYSQVVPPYTGQMQSIAKVNAYTAGLRVNSTEKKGGTVFNYGMDVNYSAKDGNRRMKMIMEMDDQVFISQKDFNLWRDAWIANTGVYGNLNFQNKKFIYNVNGRLDYNYSSSGDTLILRDLEQKWFNVKPRQEVMWSISGIAAWYPNNKISIKAGLARGARAPDLQERYIKFLAVGADSYDYLGNPDLLPEINYQVDLMLDYETGNLRIYSNLFGSKVQNFITGKLLPPARFKPLSMGAPGVKQFNNVKWATLLGFEAGVSAILYQKLSVVLNAGYTYAYFTEIEKIILENNQAIGTVTLKNDPIPEIPPFEAIFKTSYSFLNNMLQPELVIVLALNQQAVSKSAYEKPTPGFVLFEPGLTYRPFTFATLHLGVKNLTNRAYTMHLNRNIIGSTNSLYEPGRTFYINLVIDL